MNDISGLVETRAFPPGFDMAALQRVKAALVEDESRLLATLRENTERGIAAIRTAPDFRSGGRGQIDHTDVHAGRDHRLPVLEHVLSRGPDQLHRRPAEGDRRMRLYLLPLGTLQPLGVPVPGIPDSNRRRRQRPGGHRHAAFLYIEHPPGPQGPFMLRVDMRPEDHIVQPPRLRRPASRGHRLPGLHPTSTRATRATMTSSPAPPLVVQRRHDEAARAGHARFATVREHWDAPGLRYPLVEGDTTLLPGVELLDTTGHVPRPPVGPGAPAGVHGPVLLAIDAVPHSSMTRTRKIASGLPQRRGRGGDAGQHGEDR